MTTSEPHAAFPSLPPPSRASGSSRNLIPVPTSAELKTLIGQSRSLSSIKTDLIRALERVAEADDHSPLLMAEENLDELPDADMGGLSVALVYILTARLEKATESGKSDAALLDLSVKFAHNFDVEQLRLCLRRVSRLSSAILRHAQLCKKVDIVLSALYNLATIPPYSGCMMGSQAVYLEACLITRTYNGVSQIVSEVYVDFKSAECTYLDVITFYHHAGLLSASQRDHATAKELFVITPSAIQITAAKRAILCELLATGKVLQTPKSTSSTVVRAIEKNASEYTNLAKAFAESNWAAVQHQANEHKKIWDQDCNYGLIQQVTNSVVKRKILKAKTMYSRMTVDQLLAKAAGDQPMTTGDLVGILTEIVSSGEISAVLSDSSPQIITFPEDSMARGDAALAQISQSRSLAGWLENHLAGTGRQLGLDPKYLRKQAGIIDAASSGKSSGGRGNTMDDIDLMIAAEERGVGGPVRGAGSNLNDMGF